MNPLDSMLLRKFDIDLNIQRSVHVYKTYERAIKKSVSIYAGQAECAKLKIQNVGRKIVFGG